MQDRLSAVAKVLAIAATAAVGLALLAATPMLLFFGGWTGADSGSVARGMAVVLGLPWLIYLACAAAVRALLRMGRPLLACVLAVALVYPVIWLGRNFSAWP